jgi:hypothetical protein
MKLLACISLLAFIALGASPLWATEPVDVPAQTIPKQPQPIEPVTPMPQETGGFQAAPDLLPESDAVTRETPPAAVPVSLPNGNSSQAAKGGIDLSETTPNQAAKRSITSTSKSEALLRKARNARTSSLRRKYLRAYRAALRSEARSGESRSRTKTARSSNKSRSSVYLQSRHAKHTHRSHHAYVEGSSHHRRHHSRHEVVVYEYVDYGW